MVQMASYVPENERRCFLEGGTADGSRHLPMGLASGFEGEAVEQCQRYPMLATRSSPRLRNVDAASDSQSNLEVNASWGLQAQQARSARSRSSLQTGVMAPTGASLVLDVVGHPVEGIETPRSGRRSQSRNSSRSTSQPTGIAHSDSFSGNECTSQESNGGVWRNGSHYQHAVSEAPPLSAGSYLPGGGRETRGRSRFSVGAAPGQEESLGTPTTAPLRRRRARSCGNETLRDSDGNELAPKSKSVLTPDRPTAFLYKGHCAQLATSNSGMYGEMVESLVRSVVDYARLYGADEQSVFADLGSGRGAPCVIAAYEFNWLACIGIEKCEQAYSHSLNIMGTMLERGAGELLRKGTDDADSKCPEHAIAFCNEDLTIYPNYDGITHIYSFDAAMEAPLLNLIVQQFMDSETAWFYASFRPDLITRFDLKGCLLRHKIGSNMWVSGEGRTCYIYVKENWAECKSRHQAWLLRHFLSEGRGRGVGSGLALETPDKKFARLRVAQALSGFFVSKWNQPLGISDLLKLARAPLSAQREWCDLQTARSSPSLTVTRSRRSQLLGYDEGLRREEVILRDRLVEQLATAKSVRTFTAALVELQRLICTQYREKSFFSFNQNEREEWNGRPSSSTPDRSPCRRPLHSTRCGEDSMDVVTPTPLRRARRLSSPQTSSKRLSSPRRQSRGNRVGDGPTTATSTAAAIATPLRGGRPCPIDMAQIQIQTPAKKTRVGEEGQHHSKAANWDSRSSVAPQFVLSDIGKPTSIWPLYDSSRHGEENQSSGPQGLASQVQSVEKAPFSDDLAQMPAAVNDPGGIIPFSVRDGVRKGRSSGLFSPAAPPVSTPRASARRQKEPPSRCFGTELQPNNIQARKAVLAEPTSSRLHSGFQKSSKSNVALRPRSLDEEEADILFPDEEYLSNSSAMLLH